MRGFTHAALKGGAFWFECVCFRDRLLSEAVSALCRADLWRRVGFCRRCQRSRLVWGNARWDDASAAAVYRRSTMRSRISGAKKLRHDFPQSTRLPRAATHDIFIQLYRWPQVWILYAAIRVVYDE